LIRTRTTPDLANLDEAREHVIRVGAMFPTIVAAFHRQRTGNEPVAPNPALPLMANFLYMLHGKESDADNNKVFDICQILQMEHGFNASTFAGRVVGSTLSPVNTSLSAAVAGLFGQLHGGADERAFLMARDTIGSPDKAEQWVKDALAKKIKIMGFGHRVYKTTDPRATILDPLAAKMVESGKGNAAAYKTLQVVQKTAEAAMVEKGKELGINVDFYKGVVLDGLGIPTDMFTTMFAISRVWGWGAHLIELWGDHRLYRPKAYYTGEKDLPVPDPA
jgi:citrate synthase